MHNIKYKLTKLDSAEAAKAPSAASEEEYRQSLIFGENLSPSVGYWITGELLAPLRKGSIIHMKRESRNGEMVDGIFISSVITSYDEETGIIQTGNSVYLIEKISGQ
jgi:hypothetical protein